MVAFHIFSARLFVPTSVAHTTLIMTQNATMQLPYGDSDSDTTMAEIMLYPPHWSAQMVSMWAAEEQVHSAVVAAIETLNVSGEDLAELRVTKSAPTSSGAVKRLAAELRKSGIDDPREVLEAFISKWRFLLSVTEQMTAGSSMQFEKAEVASLQLESESGLAEMQRILNARQQSTFAVSSDASRITVVELNPRPTTLHRAGSPLVMHLGTNGMSSDDDATAQGASTAVAENAALSHQFQDFFETALTRMGAGVLGVDLDDAEEHGALCDNEDDDCDDDPTAALHAAVCPREVSSNDEDDEFADAFAAAQKELRYRAPAT